MIVDTKAKFDTFLAALRSSTSPYIVRDTETTGLDMFGYGDRWTKSKGGVGGGERIEEEVKKYGSAKACGEAIGIPNHRAAGINTYYLPYRHEDVVETPTYSHKLKQKQLPLDCMAEVTKVMNDRGLTYINHNVKFDLKILHADGAMPDEDRVKLADTMLLAHVLDERHEHYTLEDMVQMYTDHPMRYKGWVKDELKKRKLRRYSQFTVSELGVYAEDDVLGTWKLWKTLYPRLRDPASPWFGGADLEELFWHEMKAIWVTTWMEIRGVKFDREQTIDLSEKLFIDLEGTLLEIADFVGRYDFNPGSYKQMTEFWESQGWPVALDPLKGTASFTQILLLKLLPLEKSTGHRLDHPDYPDLKDFIMLLGKGRSLSKLRKTYLESFLVLGDNEDYLHPQYHHHGTVTGRLSSSQPNFQNIPKTVATGRTALQKTEDEIIHSPVRQVIIPRSKDHRIVSVDFSQQEVRLFLSYTEEPTMQQIIRDGGDVHHYAASKMFGGMPEDKKSDEYKRKRHMAKFINFGIFYGMGARKLGDFFDITLEEAKVYYNGYLDAFPGIRSKIEEVRGVADTRGYVRDIFGRRRRMRPLTAEERRLGKVKQKGGWTTASVRAEDKMADAHKALNAIIQGGAADMVKESMIRCHALLRGTKSFLVNQIHDELVFEIHVDEMDELLPKIKEAMTTWDLKTPFQIPFGVDVSVAKWDWSTSEASKV